jgi:chromate transporter
VGILLAALYDPIWVAAIHARGDFALALAAFGLLMFWKTPPIAVVALAAAGGELLARV